MSKEGKLKGFYSKHPIISNIILIIVAGLIFCWLSFMFLDIWTHHGAPAVVPDVVDMSYDKACERLRSEGFDVEISDSIYDERYAPGTVMSVWPRPGAVVKAHRDIFLTISSFQTPLVEIRNPLRDISSIQALEYLNNLNIKNVRIEHVISQFDDLVLSATYKGKEITQGMRIPMDAKVILKVGMVPEGQEEFYTGGLNEEDSIANEVDSYEGAYD